MSFSSHRTGPAASILGQVMNDLSVPSINGMEISTKSNLMGGVMASLLSFGATNVKVDIDGNTNPDAGIDLSVSIKAV